MANEDDGWYDSRFDPYLVAVGRIAGIWAQLEFLINDAIWELANVEGGAGACLTAQIVSSNGRIKALVSLVHYRGARDELLKAFNKFGSDVDDLGRQRNRFVHDPVGINKDTGELFRVNVTADRKLDSSLKVADFSAMAALHREIAQTCTRFGLLYGRALNELPPWPRKQFASSPRGILASRSH
ncbi:MAG: hypothetical protein ABSC92_00460 [Rhizomicrobium sp.]|jgi:hypothetical protein